MSPQSLSEYTEVIAKVQKSLLQDQKRAFKRILPGYRSSSQTLHPKTQQLQILSKAKEKQTRPQIDL
jgi:hypothetical protein